jgi:hypothetical protein
MFKESSTNEAKKAQQILDMAAKREIPIPYWRILSIAHNY